MKNHGCVSPQLPHLFHGGDYNPEQWLDDPKILSEDIRLMKLAGVNTVNIGIFAWAFLEPEEGRYDLDWLALIIDTLYKNNIYSILATPSGARPAWMAEKYPEVLRVGPDLRRGLFAGRHNHCFTSPVYREKVAAINAKLAERFAQHPGMVLWHISNEYGGDCFCELCEEAFRTWLKKQYDNDLDRLNRAWWTAFWSHTYQDWSQIRTPSRLSANDIHGMNLDWKRFVTYQTVDFMKAEIETVRKFNRNIPVTTNMMGPYPILDYWKIVPHLDVVGWDSYPLWHGRGPVNHPWANWDSEGRDWKTAADIGFIHDLYRSFKQGKPFLVIESSPSAMNWSPAMKLKRPGMHLLASLQCIAHGSDSVQYFQWRKSRGGAEKFHGAVVDVSGTEHTRVFSDVADAGRALAKLDNVAGTGVVSETAIICDWENRWAIEDAQGPLDNSRKRYDRTCQNHYYPFWTMGIPADIIDQECDFSPYKLVIAPMLYLVKKGVAERLEKFVNDGGTLVGTYWSGIVDENDLCFLGGIPGPLRKLFGIRSEEIDALYAVEKRSILFKQGNQLGMKGTYSVYDLCDLIHPEGAEELAAYDEDFYKGRPALTVNRFGKGSAYYMASRNDEKFLMDFYTALASKTGLSKPVPAPIPEGVSVRERQDEKNRFLFLLNFKPEAQQVNIGKGDWTDILGGQKAGPTIRLGAYGVVILCQPVK